MWARILGIAIGLFLMVAPDTLGYDDPAAANHHIVGPLAASFSFIAIWAILRSLRWFTLVAGAWLLASPWVFSSETTPAVISLTAGVVLMLLPFVAGEKRQTFAGGWVSLLPGRPLRSERPGSARSRG